MSAPSHSEPLDDSPRRRTFPRVSYRDEHEALRARLAATEQRLHIAEEELADAKRRIDEHVEQRSWLTRSRRNGAPRARAARRYWPFSSELDTFAYGRNWELISAGLSLIVSATLFSLGDISATLAVTLVTLSLAGVGLLSRWMRSTRRRAAAHALEELANDGVPVADLHPEARTRVGVDPAVVGNGLAAEKLNADTLEERGELPSSSPQSRQHESR